MSSEFEQCEASAMKLPLSERAALAARLIASLDDATDADQERAWLEEADRRYQAYAAGRISARPAADALREARARIA